MSKRMLQVAAFRLQLFCDLLRNAATCSMRFDIFDHLHFGLAEISDQLAGLIRRGLAVARGLDQLAAPLRLFAQRDEFLHAVVRRTALGRGHGGRLETTTAAAERRRSGTRKGG